MDGSVQMVVEVVDSHTAGEPTRVVTAGGPDLGRGSMASRLDRFRESHSRFRSAVVNEPRGSDILVGALLLPPESPHSTAGVIFFNNVGWLGMCGHGLIGLVTTLAHMGRIEPGELTIETPVGPVRARLDPSGCVAVRSVPSRCCRRGVELLVPGFGPVTGSIAWGGNWFFLAPATGLEIGPESVDELTRLAWAVRRELDRQGIRGDDGAEVDHIEFHGPPWNPANHSRNFVLCPGGAYDRSPCGTGTSAYLSCLAASGALKPGEVWRQESVIGSLFEASYELEEGLIVPTITGRAHITAEARLILDPDDPFVWGLG